MKKGDTVALVAPASPVPRGAVADCVHLIEDMGYRAAVGASCRAAHGYLSGDDITRAEDVNAAFRNPHVKGVFCLRGGYGTQRILDKLDYAAIRRRHKFFGGYSDITALHIAFAQFCGLRTYHMPMAGKLAGGVDDYTMAGAEACFAERLRGEIHNPGGGRLTAVTPGSARGVLIGGNLCVLAASLGTPFEIDTRGKILFLEDVNEPPYKLDRALTQLRLAGKLAESAGVVFGAFTDCAGDGDSLTLPQIIADTLPKHIPCVSGLQCGHCLPTASLPLGALAELDAGNGKLTILK